MSRSQKQKPKAVTPVSDIVDQGIECELEFPDNDFSNDGKLHDEIDVDKDSDGCRCASSPEERSSSVYSSPSDTSPTPPPPPSASFSHLQHPRLADKRPSLDLTKEHLKEFVSRWTDNPYLFDSPRGVISHVNCTSDFGDSSTNSNITNDSASANHNHVSHSAYKSDTNNNTSSTTSTEREISVSSSTISNFSQTYKLTSTSSKRDATDFNSTASRNQNSTRSQTTDSSSAGCNNHEAGNNSTVPVSQDHDMSDKMECGLNIVSQIRRFSQQLHEELELMKKQCGSCNAIRKYSISDVSVNAQ